MKKIILILIAILITLQPAVANAAYFGDISKFPWAAEAINRLAEAGVMNGTGNENFSPEKSTTRAEYITTMMRMLGKTAKFDANFADVKEGTYYYDYVGAAKALGYVSGREDGLFYPSENISRQDMFVMTARILGISPSVTQQINLIYKDSSEISDYAKPYIAQISEFIAGDGDNRLNPKNGATRAEMAVFVDRVRTKMVASPTPSPGPTSKPTSTPTPTPITSGTFLRGEAVVTVEQAKAWAGSNGASQKFIDAADIYWKYGAQTGIRADILYAQSAKETRYGLFGGRVTEDMNNWAGIKRADSTGDTKEDHESFPTSDDGVRAHFNHMAAYVGVSPIGTPHARYNVVMSTSWAGTIRFVEELGGRWAPEEGYGTSIISNYLNPMKSYRQIVVDKSKKVVYLSPSNQYANIYATGSTNEGEQMNLLGALVKTELENRGFTVVMSNPSSSFQERADEAAEAGAFCYVALHSNAANKAATGTETWYRADDAESVSLSSCIQKAVEAVSPSVGRGLKNGTVAGLAEIRLPGMPNCLLEVEFHDVAPMAEWIIENKPKIAKAIADAIEEYWRK